MTSALPAIPPLPAFPVLLTGALCASAAMALAWLIQHRTRNASWVDMCWSLATGIIGAALALAANGFGAPLWRRAIIAAFALAWGLRLGLHIAARARSGHEDPRYAQLRTDWGARYDTRMFGFLQIQALVAFVLAATVWLAAGNPVQTVRLTDLLGVAILAGSVAGEALADSQLARFRADPANKGRICDTGLWGWSRHPNYFFEALGWVGYALFAIDLGGPYWQGWLAIAGPAMMYWLLRHVSGVPMVEQAMEKSRGAQFAEYRRRTSAFFPWPPSRKGSGA